MLVDARYQLVSCFPDDCMTIGYSDPQMVGGLAENGGTEWCFIEWRSYKGNLQPNGTTRNRACFGVEIYPEPIDGQTGYVTITSVDGVDVSGSPSKSSSAHV